MGGRKRFSFWFYKNYKMSGNASKIKKKQLKLQLGHRTPLLSLAFKSFLESSKSTLPILWCRTSWRGNKVLSIVNCFGLTGYLVIWWPRISLTTSTNDELLRAWKFDAGKLCKTWINNSDLSSSLSSTSQTSPPVSLPRMEEDQVSFCSSYQIYNLYQ